MDKKGVAQLAIFGISITVIIIFLFRLWAVNLVFEEIQPELEKALSKLGMDNICPEEFNTQQYKVCFNAKGDVIVDGLIDDSVTIKIEGATDSCHIKTGNYDFEYSGCKLNNFKQLEAYNILLISSKGKVSLKGASLLKKIVAGSSIIKISPKGIRWLRRLSYFLRFA